MDGSLTVGYVYRPNHQVQLGPGAGPTGGVDCTAYAAAVAIDRATMGGTLVTGRAVRLASNEPYPDPYSPGLSINQVIAVAQRWHVQLVDRRGAPWSSLLAMLKAGRGVILQGDYDRIPAKYSGQTSFTGDHAVYINHISGDGDLYWMDPLRKAGAIEIPAVVARAYGEKLAKAWGVFPGLLFATTRITPTIAEPQ